MAIKTSKDGGVKGNYPDGWKKPISVERGGGWNGCWPH